MIENEERTPELKEFLSELSDGSGEHVIRPSTYQHYRRVGDLKDAIQKSVSTEIAKFYREPVYTLSREEMYTLGTSIIRSAHKRLYLYQRTPSIILGARDYLAEDHTKYAYEKEFNEVLKGWIDTNHKADEKEFLYLFSGEATRQEIDQESLADHPDYIERLKQRISEMKNLETKSGYRFRIGLVDVPISGPLIVGDNRFGLWLLGGDDAVSISQENEKICSILVRMLRAHSQKSLDTKEIFKALGIEKE
ncbi:MAG: hypothetical protein Q7N50_15310 [Armatimonadota bacterium]|nr:hypothetical protein [Armatimonadota bacterium]